MRPATTPNPLPRLIAPGVFWIGKCNALADAGGRGMHSYNSAYLVVGDDRSAVIAPDHGVILRGEAVGTAIAALDDVLAELAKDPPIGVEAGAWTFAGAQ